jgi:hypothetical protein
MTSVLLILLLLQQDAYHMLKEILPQADERVKAAEYFVSVDKPLNRSGVEKLICQIINSEKPPKFDRLDISIFVGLEKYQGLEDSDPFQLARYVWNHSLPRVRGRLVMMKGEDNRSLDPWQSSEFEQDRVCH